MSHDEAKELYMSNKELFEEIRIEQKAHTKILQQHDLNIQRNTFKIDNIEKTLSKGNILKWNFAGIIVANIITYVLQLLT